MILLHDEDQFIDILHTIVKYILIVIYYTIVCIYNSLGHFKLKISPQSFFENPLRVDIKKSLGWKCLFELD